MAARFAKLVAYAAPWTHIELDADDFPTACARSIDADIAYTQCANA